MSAIKHLIVHYSASEYGCFDVINEWHKQKGWGNSITDVSCGYNIIIPNGRFYQNSHYNKYLDGIIQCGRGLNLDNYISPDEQGAHTLGYNYNSIGVCCCGFKLTRKQFKTVEIVCKFYKGLIPEIEILGHNDLNNTECPGFDVIKWWNEVENK